MPDDRDWSWLNRNALTAQGAPPAERRLWVLVKAARSAQAIVRAHPVGEELRVLIGSELVWSQVFRAGDAPTLADVAAQHRAGFIARGWEAAA